MQANRDQEAGEAALGLPDEAERRRLMKDAAAEPELRAAIENWEHRLAPLAFDLPAEEPPAGSFDAIMARIGTSAAEPRGTRTTRANAGGWIDAYPGVRTRILNRDAQTRRQTVFLQVEPGAVYPDHPHDTTEEMFILTGDLIFGDFELHAGDHHLARPDSAHPPSFSRSGCTALLISSY